MPVLIASVGYRNLRDLSAAHAVMPALERRAWPGDIKFEDFSIGPIAIMQSLQDELRHYDRIVLVSSVERGREPGRVYSYRWDGSLPDPDEIQQRVGEAVTGVISLDNLLIITQYFGVLPKDVRIVEIEPADTGWGPGFTTAVEGALGEMIEAVWQAATEE